MPEKQKAGDTIVGVRMDEATLAELEEVGQRRRIRSKSDRVRYLMNLGLQVDRGQFPQPQQQPARPNAV